MEDKKPYWKMYQDRDHTADHYIYVFLDLPRMLHQMELFFDNNSEDAKPPVFEPVLMTEDEFKTQAEGIP